ncbi:MAG: NadS family protein [Sulfurimicrobium sp.]|nr:NadS family protein [Sulfurimicrobium sp.]MDP1704865.1 NadS family protein [Sulfurimicrobium sp.]MDP2199928.1 NadS family protein [Sulfurimicrobium sp.]
MDDSTFEELLSGVREAGMIMRGEMKPARVTVIADPEAKEIREATKLTQGEFARLIGVPVKTLQNWEQHRTRPTGPARALLRAVAKDPETAIRLLAPV